MVTDMCNSRKNQEFFYHHPIFLFQKIKDINSGIHVFPEHKRKDKWPKQQSHVIIVIIIIIANIRVKIR